MHKLSLCFLAALVAAGSIAQNVGIGTTAPQAMLHVKDSNVLFNGPNPFVSYTPAANPPASGPGTRMMWYAQKGAFRAGWVEDNRWDKDSIGPFSIALGHSPLALNVGSVALGIRTRSLGFGATASGYATEANADYSFAAGYLSKANGQIATAIGAQNNAIGFFSTAIGNNNTTSNTSAVALGESNHASGINAVAIGSHIRVKARGAFATGWYNDTSDFPDPVFVAPNDRLLQIGNGNGFLGTYSNALTVLRNGNHGLGTVTPQARLHVADSSVLFTGATFLSGGPYPNPPVSGAGSRTMWYPAKAAFRTGMVFANQWDNDSIGLYSFATGLNTVAKGDFAFALGNNNRAIGVFSFAGGSQSRATDRASFAFGEQAEAAGYQSVALGPLAKATGFNAVSIGSNTTAIGIGAASLGYFATSPGTFAYSFGNNTIASGSPSVAIGINAKAQFDNSMSIGYNTEAAGSNSIVMGFYNDLSTAGKLFEIGNGTSSLRTNALTILQNGNTGIGVVNPSFKLEVGGRMLIRSGGSLAQSAGIWLNNTANSSTSAFVGMANDNNLVGFFGNNGGGWGLAMNTNTGYVGIGLNTGIPAKPLSFPATLGEKILLYPGATGEVGIGVYGNELRIHSDYAAARISFGHQDNAGNFTQTMWLNNTTGVLTVGGTAYPSDERFKENISPIAHPLQKIAALHGVEYTMRKAQFPEMNFSRERQVGLLAQEVEQVMPSAVYTIHEKGYKGVDYAKLVPLLVESIKAQQVQINNLQQELHDLRQQTTKQ